MNINPLFNIHFQCLFHQIPQFLLLYHPFHHDLPDPFNITFFTFIKTQFLFILFLNILNYLPFAKESSQLHYQLIFEFEYTFIWVFSIVAFSFFYFQVRNIFEWKFTSAFMKWNHSEWPYIYFSILMSLMFQLVSISIWWKKTFQRHKLFGSLSETEVWIIILHFYYSIIDQFEFVIVLKSSFFLLFLSVHHLILLFLLFYLLIEYALSESIKAFLNGSFALLPLLFDHFNKLSILSTIKYQYQYQVSSPKVY